MEEYIRRLAADFPSYQFSPGDSLHWSPRGQNIFYTAEEPPLTVMWGILHELGHAELKHTSYQTDTALLRMEVAAWKKAQRIAQCYSVIIDEAHIENCLDTYRDWLHKRSTCPSCSSHGCQTTPTRYACINCTHAWIVGRARFCRPYRRVVIATN